MPQQQIAPPFGYREIVPLLKTHKLRLPAAGQVPEFLQRNNAVPISHTEFQVIGANTPSCSPPAMRARPSPRSRCSASRAGENLFVADGAWAGGVYVPAYARRYPFCMARVTHNQVEQKDRLICVEKAAVDDAGEAMFDAEGKPVQKWVDIQRLLTEYEADLERSREMCSVLADYGVLEPFSMQATLNKDKGGGALQLTGMQRVERAEAREPQRGAAEEPDAQGLPRAHLPAPAVARELCPPARAQGGPCQSRRRRQDVAGQRTTIPP